MGGSSTSRPCARFWQREHSGLLRQQGRRGAATKALSNEWASKGVNVNAIAPGYMETELTKDLREKNPTLYEEISARIPKGRWGRPEDLMGLAVFLAGDASEYVSGAVIPLDGGYLGK